ncbi:MAG TPA: ATP-binding protein [Bryobacteraceae bacterium]
MSDQDLSEFLLRACHDLRSPLRSIRAHAESIRKTPNRADLDQRLDFIIDGAQKIDLLTEGLTRYSIALQTDPALFQVTKTEVILRTALAKLEAEVREHNAEVTRDELPSVSCNPDRLVQVFENLLQNALRHGGRSSPRIHVNASKQNREWLFAIRDNGHGIDATYLERVFKPFEGLQTRERAGAGLGLPISRVIVERHGGRLWAESTPETGATFLFTLPAIAQ